MASSPAIFRFTDLPKEIRLEIYEFLPIQTRHFTVPTFLEDKGECTFIIRSLPVAILATCKAVHEEAHGIIAAKLLRMRNFPPQILISLDTLRTAWNRLSEGSSYTSRVVEGEVAEGVAALKLLFKLMTIAPKKPKAYIEKYVQEILEMTVFSRLTVSSPPAMRKYILQSVAQWNPEQIEEPECFVAFNGFQDNSDMMKEFGRDFHHNVLLQFILTFPWNHTRGTRYFLVDPTNEHRNERPTKQELVDAFCVEDRDPAWSQQRYAKFEEMLHGEKWRLEWAEGDAC